MKTEHVEEPLQQISRTQLSLRELLLVVLVVALVAGYWVTARRLSLAEAELAKLRIEVGFLEPSRPDQIAAVRAPNDQPLTYQFRVRVPKEPRYRVAYSSVWEKDSSKPNWFAAVSVPEGESLVIVRVMKDMRDERWKISAIVQSDAGTKRVGTVLPDEHVQVFRQSADALSAGVGKQTVTVAGSGPLRLLDEKWLVGEGSLMLYGDSPPRRDQIGIYAELQPDIGTL